MSVAILFDAVCTGLPAIITLQYVKRLEGISLGTLAGILTDI